MREQTDHPRSWPRGDVQRIYRSEMDKYWQEAEEAQVQNRRFRARPAHNLHINTANTAAGGAVWPQGSEERGVFRKSPDTVDGI